MRLRILILTVQYPHEVAYYLDWVEAFETHKALAVTVHDIGSKAGKRLLPSVMRDVDAIVALHTTTSDWLADLVDATPYLLDRRAPLVVFVGNEFNQPFPWLSDKIAAVKNLHAEIVASQLLQETAQWLYAETGARVVSLPHAVNPRRFFPGANHGDRPLDVASRSFRYPIYLGDDHRNRIFAAVAQLASTSTLAIDISLDEHLHADAWAELLRSARATVSTEAGTWILERDDATARAVEQLLRRTGRADFGLPAPIRRQLRRLPGGLKNFLRRASRHLPLTYAPLVTPDQKTTDLVNALFARAPRPQVYGKCISARHFEALGTKTLQLLTPGRYNDILTPNVHYLEIAADGSNLREMIEMTRDPRVWTRVTEAAFALGQESTYTVRIDRLIAEIGGGR